MDVQSFGRTPRESDRLYRRQVDRAWHALVDGRIDELDTGVRDVVRDSWLRCLAMGVEPLAQRPGRFATGGSLEALRGENAELLHAFQNTWRVLGDILSDTHSCLIIADDAGTMLDICGSPLVLSLGERDGICPGYAWSEQSGGTNAIGTAIARNAPAEVHSAEHLLSVAKRWSCSAAPVRDVVDGRLLGVVDVTSFGEHHQQHCLALAVTAAHQIEETLNSRELARSVQLLHWYQGIASSRPHQALILLDRKGRLLIANDLARALFADAREGAPIERGQPFLGTPVTPTLTQAALRLPPRTRAVALEPWTRARRGWEGGLLVLEPSRDSPRPAPRARAEPVDHFATLIGESPGMLEAKRRAQRLARAAAPVLIEGAGGTGKTRLAQAVHEASSCAGGPFVTVPCLTLDTGELTAALFGREPAANGTARCLVEDADGGSLYLEEVARLSLSAQLGLLRLVQEGVLPVPGGFPPRRVHVRVLAGTAEDLVQAVAEGRFRLDLFQRLKVLAVRLPGLHERAGDMGALVARFLSEFEATHGLGARRASDALVVQLASLRLAGHLDELKRLLEQMYVMTESDTLEPAHLPVEYLAPDDAMSVATARIDELERAAITQALAHPGAKASAVARELGISRSTLYRKLKRYGLA